MPGGLATEVWQRAGLQPPEVREEVRQYESGEQRRRTVVVPGAHAVAVLANRSNVLEVAKALEGFDRTACIVRWQRERAA